MLAHGTNGRACSTRNAFGASRTSFACPTDQIAWPQCDKLFPERSRSSTSLDDTLDQSFLLQLSVFEAFDDTNGHTCSSNVADSAIYLEQTIWVRNLHHLPWFLTCGYRVAQAASNPPSHQWVLRSLFGRLPSSSHRHLGDHLSSGWTSIVPVPATFVTRRISMLTASPDPGKRSARMQREHSIRRHVVERACPLKLMLFSSP